MERSCSLLKNYEQKAKAPFAITASVVIGIIGAVIAAATLIVSIVALVISINTYNDRYNTAFTDAKSAQEVQFTYKSNGKTSGSASVTMSAGNIYYGYFQNYGTSNTQYVISYKKYNSSKYTTAKTVTVHNNNNYYGGDYVLTNANSAMKYDIKVEKKNNVSSNSQFVLDLAI